MGMYDCIDNVIVDCPKCGNTDPKLVQIKCGPQTLETYLFGKDEISVDWDYPYYGAIVDREKHIIGGIATCENCREDSNKKMKYLIAEANRKGEIKRPDGAKYLIECEIGGKNAFGVLMSRLDETCGGNRNIESFHVSIRLKDNIAISAEVLQLERSKM